MTNQTPSKTSPIPATRLEHVALAVPDLDAAISFYSETFGLAVSEAVVSKEQGVRMAYVEFGNAKIELMEPVGDASPIATFALRLTMSTTQFLAQEMPVSVFLVTALPSPAITGKSFFFFTLRILWGSWSK